MNDALLMPPEIAAPVIGVCKKVKVAVKEHVNKHGGYKYVSVDKFYEDMGPLLAEAGLIIMMHERAVESDGKWLNVTYDIYLISEGGKTYGPVTRTQGVLANGPQAYAAAQSFAEKYFMRQLFKIPTGEEEADADSQPRSQIPATKKTTTPAAEAYPADASAQARDACLSIVTMAKTVSELRQWAVDNNAVLAKMLDADRDAVRKAYAEHEKVLKQKEAA